MSRSAVPSVLAIAPSTLRPRPLSSVVAAAIALATLAGAAAPTIAQPGFYHVLDLGAVPASSVCPCFQAMSLSDAGHAAGLYFAPDGTRRAFLYNQSMADIGTLGGIAQAFGVNDAGVVVGYSVDPQGRQRAIRQHQGVIADLGTLQNGIHANANGVNNQGWIVGMSQRKFGTELWQRAALWQGGTVTDLGTFGGEYAEAEAVNDAGQVVGWAWDAQRRQRAFLWTAAGGLRDLGTLPGGVSSGASDVSDLGVVVGFSVQGDGSYQGFRWTEQGGMAALPAPAGAVNATPAAVNDGGNAVGSAFNPIQCSTVPVLWHQGRPVNLNTVLAPGSGWTVIAANDINSRGEIAASARFGGGPYRAIVLIPASDVSRDAAR
ncbi:MAG: hypothetical protein WD749_00350 [Phycisphaerales bacterium]